MKTIEIDIYCSTTTFDIMDDVLCMEPRIPFGGVVYAGICRLLTEPEPLDKFPDPMNNEEAQDYYLRRKVVLSKYVYDCLASKYGDDTTRALTHLTTQMARIGYGNHDLLNQWYVFVLPGSGSGKISKTKNA
jgi:hypothetical protein